MKRLLVVILSLVYFAASSGFTLRQHYCMGQLSGTAIDHPAHYAESHACSKCGMEKKNDDNGCCKDKVKNFKASPDQIPAKALSFSGVPFVGLVPQHCYLPEVFNSISSLATRPAAPPHGPPGEPSLPLFLRVRSLLI